MRAFDLSPLYRTSIGFDHLASMLDEMSGFEGDTNNYPPFNIELIDENKYRLSMAVAGLRIPGVRILGEDCVAKSFPDFWEHFGELQS